MKKQAEVIHIGRSSGETHGPKISVALDSGRNILIHADGEKDLLEVTEADGGVALTISLTDNGPVVSLKGAHLDLEACERLRLKAKTVEIEAEESAAVQSRGGLEVGASDEMNIRSEADVRINGKMIHLN